MAKSEHDWGTKEYDQEWVSKDSRRAAEREAQFNAAISWLSVFIGGRSREKLLATFPEMSVICSDGSDEMLRLARQRLDAFGDRASFVQSDFGADKWIAELPRELDAVVSARAIHNLRKLKLIGPVYGQIFELLRPGGLFLNIERVNFSTPALRRYYKDLQMKTRGRTAKMDGAAPNLLQQFRLLKRAGFRDIDCFWREGNTAIVGGFKKA
jgi:tRNA (cmo5U34)-methyltransferase